MIYDVLLHYFVLFVSSEHKICSLGGGNNNNTRKNSSTPRNSSSGVEGVAIIVALCYYCRKYGISFSHVRKSATETRSTKHGRHILLKANEGNTAAL
jgi:hypothetical protein